MDKYDKLLNNCEKENSENEMMIYRCKCRCLLNPCLYCYYLYSIDIVWKCRKNIDMNKNPCKHFRVKKKKEGEK